MLILTRRIGETVKIGNDISVVVLGVKGLQCRIGIDAPKDVDILRKEVAERFRLEDCRQDSARSKT